MSLLDRTLPQPKDNSRREPKDFPPLIKALVAEGVVGPQLSPSDHCEDITLRSPLFKWLNDSFAAFVKRTTPPKSRKRPNAYYRPDEPSYLTDLPHELVWLIYGFLPAKDFVALRCSARQFYHAPDEERWWKIFCHRDFSPVHNALVEHFGKTWKFIYRSKIVFKGGRKSIRNGDVGCLVTNDGRYEGEWLNGELHGYGYLVSSAGNIIEGQWNKGMGHGYGRVSYANGDLYAGQWTDGGVTGKGICYFAEGTVYRGEWKENAVDGKGVCSFSDGNRYDGQWKMGKKEGKGLFVWKNGAAFEGTWVNNKATGQGNHLCADGVTKSKCTFEEAYKCCAKPLDSEETPAQV